MPYARRTPSRDYTPYWNYWSEDSAVKRWTRELTQAAAHPGDRERWALTGQAVVVEHEDLEVMDGVLHCVANMAGLAYRRVPVAEVVSDFPAWVEALPEDTPTLVYLEAGLWVGPALEDDADELGFPRALGHDELAAAAFRQALRGFLAAGLPQAPLVLVIALKSVGHLDPQLRRQGCFDRRLALPHLGNEDLARAFVDELGPRLFDPSVTADLNHLGALVRYEFADQRRRSLLHQALRRLQWREGRPASFQDLLLFATYGTADQELSPDTQVQRRLPAIHEAGHALVAALDGPRGTIPVYVSARPRNDNGGIVVPPYDGVAEGEEHTYADMVHRIRVGLAGRAAEQLVLGADQVSATGARSDLLRVYALACDLFVANGHSPDLSSEAAVASNLAILHGQVAEADLARAEALCREFLQTQYLAVLALLRQHHAVLDRLIAALMARGVLFQDDVRQLLQPET